MVGDTTNKASPRAQHYTNQYNKPKKVSTNTYILSKSYNLTKSHRKPNPPLNTAPNDIRCFWLHLLLPKTNNTKFSKERKRDKIHHKRQHHPKNNVTHKNEYYRSYTKVRLHLRGFTLIE